MTIVVIHAGRSICLILHADYLEQAWLLQTWSQVLLYHDLLDLLCLVLAEIPQLLFDELHCRICINKLISMVYPNLVDLL